MTDRKTTENTLYTDRHCIYYSSRDISITHIIHKNMDLKLIIILNCHTNRVSKTFSGIFGTFVVNIFQCF